MFGKCFVFQPLQRSKARSSCTSAQPMSRIPCCSVSCNSHSLPRSNQSCLDCLSFGVRSWAGHFEGDHSQVFASLRMITCGFLMGIGRQAHGSLTFPAGNQNTVGIEACWGCAKQNKSAHAQREDQQAVCLPFDLHSASVCLPFDPHQRNVPIQNHRFLEP